MEGPYALAADGSAKDPQAFQQALKQDADKMAQLEQVSGHGRANSTHEMSYVVFVQQLG